MNTGAKLLLAVYIILIFPAILIYFYSYQEDLYGLLNVDTYKDALEIYAISCILFFGVSLVTYIAIGRNVSLPNISVGRLTVLHFMLNFSVLFTAFFFLTQGISKISLIGSNINASDFRVIGYDDVSLVSKFLLEWNRKIALPFLMAFFGATKDKIRFQVTLFCLILLAISTLDRFPFLIILVYFIMVWFSKKRHPITVFLGVPIAIAAIGLIGSVITYIQHNITDFDLDTILFSAYDFLLHRVMIIPTLAAVEIGAVQYLEYGALKLSFSRLSILWGGQYLGYAGQNVLFVAPVGMIADTLRNFGLIGIINVAFITAFLCRVFFEPRCRSNNKNVEDFMALNLATYWVFGNFFTLGVILLMITMIFLRIFGYYRIVK